MLFKRKQKLVPPLKRSADISTFKVYEILEQPQEKSYRKNRFVSPIFGRFVKDEIIVPKATSLNRDTDKLDPFRKDPKLTKDERIKKYGTAYPEFDLMRGKNLKEALQSQKHSNNTEQYHEETFVKSIDKESKPYPEKPPIKEVIIDTEESFEPINYEDIEEPKHKDTYVKANIHHTKSYQLPPLSLFSKPMKAKPNLEASIARQIDILNKTFEEFQIGAKVMRHTQGPTVTRYEVSLDSGVNVKKVTNIADNLKMALAAINIRIEAPIPGKNTVGIEVPNEEAETVHFIDIINTSMFKQAAQPLTVALGLDIDGNPVFASIKSMPHGLVAGATGSGKSVCINTILMSLLVKYSPSELRLLLIDPKMVELTNYNGIPHLITPVINDSKAATASLRWVVDEMELRFNIFNEVRVRDIDAYNQKITEPRDHMPYIVIIVDELADLMMISSQHVEDAIKRLTQKARACGIHLIIATQRPSTDIIKGTIKANIPTRIAFMVSSHVDSQTIIDSSGADKLLGRGDMLFVGNGQNKIRVQGAFVSDHDIEKVTTFIKNQMEVDYLFDQATLFKQISKSFDRDEYFEEVALYVVSQQEASINKISKQFSIGFNRAQSIVETLEEIGVVSEHLGSKAREVLVDKEALEKLLTELR